MRTTKNGLISDSLKPLVSKILKENREKYHYSLEDLSQALEHKKNRQTLHKYETGALKIPYEILFDICRIFNIDTKIFESEDISIEEQSKLEEKIVRNYIKNINPEKGMNKQIEKILATYKNSEYVAITSPELSIKQLDDSMSPYYLKNDQVFFQRMDEYKNGDDVIIAIKPNILSIRRLYKYPKGIIIQAMNPKYPTININILSNDLILGKVTSIKRKI